MKTAKKHQTRPLICRNTQDKVPEYVYDLEAGAPRETLDPGAKVSFEPFDQWCPKLRDQQKKVIASIDVRSLVQSQVMSKKKVIATADVQISVQHLVMSQIRS